jgi:ubiquinone/menaquinone biosynthesis C-methylase UbiE
VVATDISAGMIGYARKRTAEAGFQNIQFIVSVRPSLLVVDMDIRSS